MFKNPMRLGTWGFFEAADFNSMLKIKPPTVKKPYRWIYTFMSRAVYIPHHHYLLPYTGYN